MATSSRFWRAWTTTVAVAMAIIFCGGAAAYAVVGNQADVAAAQKELAELNKQATFTHLFRTVAKVVTPAVVEIHVTSKVKEPVMEDFVERFFGEGENPFGKVAPRGRGRMMPQPRQRQMQGLGSGVIVDAKNGYILTNNHVVAGADTVEIVLGDGRNFKAEKILTDPPSDLAVIQIKADNLIEAKLGDSSKMEIGDWVLAIGAPRNLPESVTAGIISAKGRRTTVPASAAQRYMIQDFLQTDAAINQGNSGGPLVNMNAEVIGINNSIMTSSGGNEGIGFAVPSNMARMVMTQLIEKGKVTRGFMGVAIESIEKRGMAESLGLPSTDGALVTQVTDSSPAAKAGIKSEDVIVSVDGHAVANSNELRNEVAAIDPGKTIKVDLYRDGKKQTVDVTIAALPKEMAEGLAQGVEDGQESAFGRLGLKVATLTPEIAKQLGYGETVKGVAITDVEEASDAEEQGLRPGMVIVKVNGKDVATAEEFAAIGSAESARKGVRLMVTDPSGSRQIVFVQPTSPPKTK
ncbi:MAG: Do family serine endopeptidase [Phycisphaerae bacterium]|jgi:serine protease Do